MKLLDIRSRSDWRRWLGEHHDSESDVWLVFHKVHTGVQAIPYDDAVREALCFGWIDSLVKRIDDDRYARKFTPRKPNSIWSDINRRRYRELGRLGLLEPAGIARPPSGRSYTAPKPESTPYINERIRQSPGAWARFSSLPPSHKRAYLAWIQSAKRDETREKRLDKLIQAMEQGRDLQG